MTDSRQLTPVRYLARLEAELAALPDAQRRVVVEGVAEHIEEALADGRDIDQVLAGLGSPDEVAAAYGEQLGARVGPDPSRRATRILSVAAMLIAIVAAAASPVLLPFAGFASAGDIALVIAMFVGPVALAALPLLLPRRSGYVAAALGAAAVMVVAVLALVGLLPGGTPLNDAYLLLPVGFVMCATAIVPPVTRLAPGWSRAARVVGAGLAAVPGMLPLMGALSGAVEVTWVPLVCAGVGLAMGLLYAWGRRAVYIVLAALGTVVIALTLIQQGLLFLAFWVVGGWWFALGASGFAAVPPRAKRR